MSAITLPTCSPRYHHPGYHNISWGSKSKAWILWDFTKSKVVVPGWVSKKRLWRHHCEVRNHWVDQSCENCDDNGRSPYDTKRWTSPLESPLLGFGLESQAISYLYYYVYIITDDPLYLYGAAKNSWHSFQPTVHWNIFNLTWLIYFGKIKNGLWVCLKYPSKCFSPQHEVVKQFLSDDATLVITVTRYTHVDLRLIQRVSCMSFDTFTPKPCLIRDLIKKHIKRDSGEVFAHQHFFHYVLAG